MPLLTNDPLTQLAFSIYESKGVFALLLGAGLSRAADIPTGWEITLDGDYNDARILNTESELSGYPAQYDTCAVGLENGIMPFVRRFFARRTPAILDVLGCARYTWRRPQQLIEHRKAPTIPIIDANKRMMGRVRW
ncbi:hypothetical protein [Bradyrhizobium sp. NBAIM03]|uniref:hypothetical protein n=1 Tax=Bradyrhizobium sp. NBAIM03 TaxID=2793816 RepID=UPI001CD5993F|nr:hypothetical protein [Bradyrhizobium sp. NBAIM03]